MGKNVAKKGEPTLTDLTKRAAKARTLLAQLLALFPEAQALPKDDRRRSQGRLGVEESKALRGVIDAMEAEPAIFVSLADDDQGYDPEKLETGLLRDRLERHDVYASLSDEIEAIGRVLADHALVLAASAAPVTRAAYEIAKPVSKRNAVVRAKIAPMLDYHGGNAAKAAVARKANTAKKAAKAPAGG